MTITPEDLPRIREQHRGKKIVFCSGVFDLTHAGHALFFEDCKKQGDILVVCVGYDAKIGELKGEGRPVLNERVRLKMVDAMKPVDYCLLDNIPVGENPLKTLDVVFPDLKPDAYVINDDAFDIPYREAVARRFGVELIILPRFCPPEFENISTTNIIAKIRGAAAEEK